MRKRGVAPRRRQMRRAGTKIIASVMIALTALMAFTGCPEPQNQPNKTDMTDSERAAVADYIGAFALEDHSAVLIDVSKAIAGDTVKGMTAETVYDADAGRLQVSLELSAYDYDGTATAADKRTADGTSVATFTGTGSDTAFTAKAYSIAAESGLEMNGGSKDVIMTVLGAKGTFADKPYGGSEAELVFTVKDGKCTGISTDSIGTVYLSAAQEGTVSVTDRNAVSIKTLLDALIAERPAVLEGELLGDVKATLTAVFGELTGLDISRVGDFTTEAYKGTYDFTAGDDGWSLKIMADKAASSDGKKDDLVFTVAEGVADVELTIDGKAYASAYSELLEGITLPPDVSPVVPVEMEDEQIALINGMVKAIFEDIEKAETVSAVPFTYGSYSGEYSYVYRDAETWKLSVFADDGSKDVDHDVQFVIDSSLFEEEGTITAWIGGTLYETSYENVLEGVELPFAWDIVVRLARHSRGEAEDHGNWELVDLTSTSSKISISAPVGEMAKFTSTNPVQAGKGDQAWFAILIGTGEDDITKVSYNGTALDESEIAARNNMLGADGSEARSDEFVLWMYPENAARTITLSHDGVDDKVITVEFTDTTKPEEFIWDVTARIAKHSGNNGFNDYGNYEHVTAALENGTLTIDADLSAMTAYTSTDSQMASLGDQEWFAVLIGTGEDDITKVRYGKDYLPETEIGLRNDILGADGSAAESDEFVLWLCPDTIPASITLGHENAEDVTIDVVFNDVSPDPFEWDIWFYGAKHSRGDAEDYGNWKQIERVYWMSNENPISLDIDVNLGYMTEFESTDPNQGTGKWFPILIATGETDITKVRYNGEYLTDKDIADRDDMIAITSNEERPAADDEFVLWLNATELLEEIKTVTLSHENAAEDMVINISVSDVTPDPMSEADKAALKTYILGFGHDRIILDLDKVLRGETVDGIYNHRFWDSDEGISMSISFGDAYDYDGANGSKTVSGYLDILFTGEMDDEGRFQASGYEMSTGYAAGSYVGFAGGDKDLYLIQISDLDPIKGSFASKATPDGIPLSLTFIMDGDTPVGIDEEDLKVVKFQAPVSGEVTSLESEPEQITDIIGDVSIFEESVAGFNKSDLIDGFLPYAMNPAHEATFGRLSDVKAETTTSRPGFYVNAADYDAESGALTFDLTWNEYAYNGSSSSHSSLSGNLSMTFTGTEEDGVLKASKWAVKGENLTAKNASGTEQTIDVIDISGPIFSSSPRPAATNGVAATADFILSDGQYTMTMADKTACAFGLLDLSGYMVVDGGKISAEMVNVLMDSYTGLI